MKLPSNQTAWTWAPCHQKYPISDWMTSGASSNCKSDYSLFCGASLYLKSPLALLGNGVKTGMKIWPQIVILLPALPKGRAVTWLLALDPTAAQADSPAGRVGAHSLLAVSCRTYQGRTAKRGALPGLFVFVSLSTLTDSSATSDYKRENYVPDRRPSSLDVHLAMSTPTGSRSPPANNIPGW